MAAMLLPLAAAMVGNVILVVLAADFLSPADEGGGGRRAVVDRPRSRGGFARGPALASLA